MAKGAVRVALENLTYLFLLRIILVLFFFVFRVPAGSISFWMPFIVVSSSLNSVLHYICAILVHSYIGFRISRGMGGYLSQAITTISVNMVHSLIFGLLSSALSPVWPFDVIKYIVASFFLLVFSMIFCSLNRIIPIKKTV